MPVFSSFDFRSLNIKTEFIIASASIILITAAVITNMKTTQTQTRSIPSFDSYESLVATEARAKQLCFQNDTFTEYLRSLKAEGIIQNKFRLIDFYIDNRSSNSEQNLPKEDR